MSLLFQLSEPAIIGGAYVRTLCLPQNEEVPDDTTCVAAGWGLSKIFDCLLPLVTDLFFNLETGRPTCK